MKHLGTKTLETPRLILRPLTVEDAQAMYDNWASDPEVTKFLTWPAHESVEVSRMILQQWEEGYQKDDYYQWGIVLKELGQPIGGISVVNLKEIAEKVEIGYCIGSRWWHQGIMSEAFGAVIDYLFSKCGVNRISSRHDPNNPHSGNVMKKCGLLYEGTSRQVDRNNQGICDAAHYAILKEDWLKGTTI